MVLLERVGGVLGTTGLALARLGARSQRQSCSVKGAFKATGLEMALSAAPDGGDNGSRRRWWGKAHGEGASLEGGSRPDVGQPPGNSAHFPGAGALSKVTEGAEGVAPLDGDADRLPPV